MRFSEDRYHTSIRFRRQYVFHQEANAQLVLSIVLTLGWERWNVYIRFTFMSRPTRVLAIIPNTVTPGFHARIYTTHLSKPPGYCKYSWRVVHLLPLKDTKWIVVQEGYSRMMWLRVGTLIREVREGFH